MVTTDSVGSLTTYTKDCPEASGELSTFISTYTTTDTDGNIKTTSDAIVVTTDAAGSVTTSTVHASQSENSTWITTDAEGNPLTVTSVIDATSAPSASLTSLTAGDKYTTIYPTTVIEGNTITETVVVCETTLANGDITTVSSKAPRTTSYVTSLENGSKTTVTAAVIETTVDGTVTYTTSVCPETTDYDSAVETAVEFETINAASALTEDHAVHSLNFVNQSIAQEHTRIQSAKPTGTETSEAQGSVTSAVTVPGQTGSPAKTFESIYTSTGSAIPASVSTFQAGASIPKYGLLWLLPLALFAMF